MKILQANNFDLLLNILKENEYEIIGPTIQNGAIVYDKIESSRDFPIGYTDKQTPATYRIEKSNNDAFFHFVVGPQSWKRYLYPPVQKLFTAFLNGNAIKFEKEEFLPIKYAFIGVRSCEIQAIEIQDKVFFGGEFQNNRYKTLRKNSLIIAVNCSKAESNCFCTSMESGPEVKSGYDLVLTEIIYDKEHYFLINSGSQKGDEILSQMNLLEADENALKLGKDVIEKTKSQITKHLNISNLKELLLKNIESSIWEDVAKRCLSCGNCTMVCPTCFCMTVEDYTDLQKTKAERIQKWDSCFTLEYSYIHGGSVRVSVGSRYRQWLTHKLASWHEQFGTSGCVGCGRCITWCPVGIDITEEASKIRKISEYQNISLEEN